MAGSKNDRGNRAGATGLGHKCMVKVMRGISGKVRLEKDADGACKRLTGR